MLKIDYAETTLSQFCPICKKKQILLIRKWSFLSVHEYNLYIIKKLINEFTKFIKYFL